MKKPIVKLLLILTLFAFFYNSAYSYSWKTRKYRESNYFLEIQQVPFESSKNYHPVIDNNIVQSNVYDTRAFSNDNSNTSYENYSYRTPFQETNTFLTSQTSEIESENGIMRVSNGTNDDELPGDPGQMPISDGVWFLLGSVCFYGLYKKYY